MFFYFLRIRNHRWFFQSFFNYLQSIVPLVFVRVISMLDVCCRGLPHFPTTLLNKEFLRKIIFSNTWFNFFRLFTAFKFGRCSTLFSSASLCPSSISLFRFSLSRSSSLKACLTSGILKVIKRKCSENPSTNYLFLAFCFKLDRKQPKITQHSIKT